MTNSYRPHPSSKIAACLDFLGSVPDGSKVSLNILSRKLGVSVRAVNHYIKELTDRNLIEYTKDQADGRCRNWKLTIKGKEGFPYGQVEKSDSNEILNQLHRLMHSTASPNFISTGATPYPDPASTLDRVLSAADTIIRLKHHGRFNGAEIDLVVTHELRKANDVLTEVALMLEAQLEVSESHRYIQTTKDEMDMNDA